MIPHSLKVRSSHLHYAKLIRPEKAMATHSSTLAWEIPRTEEPGRLQSMGSWRVRYDFTFTFHLHALEKEMATHSSILAWRIPGMGAWVHGIAQSWTRLMWLSSSSSKLSRWFKLALWCLDVVCILSALSSHETNGIVSLHFAFPLVPLEVHTLYSLTVGNLPALLLYKHLISFPLPLPDPSI